MNIKTRNFLKDYLILTIGAFIAAVSISLFSVPVKITPGGVTSISTVIFYVTNKTIPVGMSYLCINAILFALGWKLIGKKFIFRTIFATIALSGLIDLTQKPSEFIFAAYFSDIQSSILGMLIFSTIGGILMGIGLGLVIKFDATTGGSDMASKMINYVSPKFTIGQILVFIDSIVIVLSVLSFRSFPTLLYSLLSLVVSSVVIDWIVEGFSIQKYIKGISKILTLSIKREIEDIKSDVIPDNQTDKFKEEMTS